MCLSFWFLVSHNQSLCSRLWKHKHPCSRERVAETDTGCTIRTALLPMCSNVISWFSSCQRLPVLLSSRVSPCPQTLPGGPGEVGPCVAWPLSLLYLLQLLSFHGSLINILFPRCISACTVFLTTLRIAHQRITKDRRGGPGNTGRRIRRKEGGGRTWQWQMVQGNHHLGKRLSAHNAIRTYFLILLKATPDVGICKQNNMEIFQILSKR